MQPPIIAKDIVSHFEQRQEVFAGKSMIVAMSRRIAAELYTAKDQRKQLAERMKDPNDPLKIVIVRDMWLTGFDVPCLNTCTLINP